MENVHTANNVSLKVLKRIRIFAWIIFLVSIFLLFSNNESLEIRTQLTAFLKSGGISLLCLLIIVTSHLISSLLLWSANRSVKIALQATAIILLLCGIMINWEFTAPVWQDKIVYQESKKPDCIIFQFHDSGIPASSPQWRIILTQTPANATRTIQILDTHIIGTINTSGWEYDHDSLPAVISFQGNTYTLKKQL